ncbi:MAG TPA: hypothetical protein VLZ28_09445 [Daejeonella sp.]|nr:hypothetical protein [Daejeonella sp.]
MKILRSFLITIFFFNAGLMYAQDTLSLSTIIDKTQKLAHTYPTEKVYLHFDKPYYALGDTIWFKGYLALEQNQPSDLSKVLYVDIISDNDSLVKTLKLPVVNTSAYGSLTLDPLVYKTGNYRVRAYTYWMINADKAYFFYKNIKVGDAVNNKVITNISLKGLNAATSPTINANILFKDPDGKPLANRKVSWKVVSKFQDIVKGKGITDGSGALSLTLTANQKALLDTGILETVIEATDTRLVTSKFPLKNSFAEADIQFFPEGGELINNVIGKVAFKAIQEKGLGLGVKGEISDNTGVVVSKVQSQHFGMGSFLLTPEPGKTYTANLVFDNGIKKSVPLPAAKSAGIALAANNAAGENVLLEISANPAYYSQNQNKSYYIVARNKGVICYAAQTKLNSPIIKASIPKDKFPEGVVQLTLFSASGEPLTERLIFSKPTDVLTLSVTSDKKVYGIRKPVKMNVTAKTRNTPVEGNFSISVINETKVPSNEDQETTILSSFLLSSELKVYIEKPNYYFNKANPTRMADLDLLMLTQGYRKFSYKDILNDKDPVIAFLPEQGISFTGTLRSSNGMPVSKGRLRLVVPENRFYAEAETNTKGEFKFEKVSVPDSSEVTISARSSTAARNMMIMLDGSAFPEVSKNVNAPDEVLNIDSVLSPYLQNSKRQYQSSKMLEEVVIKSTAIAKTSHKDYPALSGLGMVADYVVDASKLQGCTRLLNCLQTAAMGLTYAEENFFVTRVYNSGLKVPVQIFYNGMPVDPSYLNNILPSDVENIEIFLKDELGTVNRMYNTNGVLVINGKKTPKGSPVTAEELRKLFPPDNVITFNPLGYLKSREFYTPRYTPEASRSIGLDLRTTVYWNPKVFTDKNGVMSFDFYNSDNKGSYKAVIEGTDIEGNLARYIYRYKVE